MNRQPHSIGFCIRPLNPMFAVRRNVEVIPREQLQDPIIILKSDAGTAFEQDHPLPEILVVPEPGRRRMPPRYDPLDFKGWFCK